MSYYDEYKRNRTQRDLGNYPNEVIDSVSVRDWRDIERECRERNTITLEDAAWLWALCGASWFAQKVKPATNVVIQTKPLKARKQIHISEIGHYPRQITKEEQDAAATILAHKSTWAMRWGDSIGNAMERLVQRMLGEGELKGFTVADIEQVIEGIEQETQAKLDNASQPNPMKKVWEQTNQATAAAEARNHDDKVMRQALEHYGYDPGTKDHTAHALFRRCGCVKPYPNGNWADIGPDRIAPYSLPGYSALKNCPNCHGRGIIVTEL